MPDLVAACTPNSLPRDDGVAEHGYQLTVLDKNMTVLTTAELPDWAAFREHAATTHLAAMGYALRSDPKFPEQDGWTPAGLGHMASVEEKDPAVENLYDENWTAEENH